MAAVAAHGAKTNLAEHDIFAFENEISFIVVIISALHGPTNQHTVGNPVPVQLAEFLIN